jgi:hypothetical protein
VADEGTQVEVDFMLLADAAQAVSGKLYVLGGGWTHVLVPEFPGHTPAPFAVAVGITVPYHLTNRRFAFGLELLDSDGTVVGDQFGAEMEQGRPPGLRPGTGQAILLAINVHPEFPAEGRYRFQATIDGEPVRSVPFEAALAPAQAAT